MLICGLRAFSTAPQFQHGEFQYQMLTHQSSSAEYFHTFRMGLLNHFQLELRSQGRYGNSLISGFSFFKEMPKVKDASFIIGFRNYKNRTFWGDLNESDKNNSIYLLGNKSFKSLDLSLGFTTKDKISGGTPVVFMGEYHFPVFSTALEFDGLFLHASIMKNLWKLLDIQIGTFLNTADTENSGLAIGIQYNSFVFARSVGNSTPEDVEAYYQEKMEYYQPENVEKRIDEKVSSMSAELKEFMKQSEQEYNSAINQYGEVAITQGRELDQLVHDVRSRISSVDISQIADADSLNALTETLDEIQAYLNTSDLKSKPAEDTLKVEIYPNRRALPIGGMSAIYEHLIYPEAAKSQYIQGAIKIEVLINPDATIGEMRFEKPDAYGGIFNKSAMEAIQKSDFQAATDENGNSIAQWCLLTIKFSFTD